MCKISLIAVKLLQIITTCECVMLESFSMTLTLSQGHVSKVMKFMNLAIAYMYKQQEWHNWCQQQGLSNCDTVLDHFAWPWHWFKVMGARFKNHLFDHCSFSILTRRRKFGINAIASIVLVVKIRLKPQCYMKVTFGKL